MSIGQVWAQRTKDADWNALQEEAQEAFAIYQAEMKATGSQRNALFRQRIEAFYGLSIRARQFIQQHLSPDTSGEFAFGLFTYALYLELAGDLWRARYRYDDVCKHIEKDLVPRGVVPRYHDTSILQLCGRQIDKLDSLVAQLGPRPTVVTILQSRQEPGPDEFLETIEPHLHDSQLARNIRAHDREPIFAYLRAEEQATKSSAGDARAMTAAVVKAIATEKGLAYLWKELNSVSVAAFSLDAKLLDQIANAMALVSTAFDRFTKSGRTDALPKVFIVRGSMSTSDAAFMTAALNDGVSVGAAYFAVNEALQLVIGREISGGASSDSSVNDYAQYFGQLLHDGRGKSLPEWLNVTHLNYPGSGVFAVEHLHSLLKPIVAAKGMQYALPINRCAPGLMALRFCILQAGVFARFLDTIPSGIDVGRSALDSVMQRGKGLGSASDARALELLQLATGYSADDLRNGFLSYAEKQGRDPATASLSNLDAVADELLDAFKSPP